MSKIKIDVIKKKLSWENNKTIIICNYRNCSEIGKYKDPKSRLNLKSYYLFCLKHVKEYKNCISGRKRSLFPSC